VHLAVRRVFPDDRLEERSKRSLDQLFDEWAEALRALVRDATVRLELGRRSRELVGAAGYGPSLDAFERAVLEAAAR
jgi:hypothetical protein